jgi:hypothetical protein
MQIKKPPGFGRAVFLFGFDPYSPLPKRRDHQPALRGAVSSEVAGVGSLGAGAEDATGSGALWLMEDAGSAAAALVTKLTFSRTVERRRAAARSASCLVSSAVGAGALSTGSGRA